MQNFLNKKLSKKSTVICIVCIAVFVISGILGAILGHQAYLNSREAKITNYSVREGSALRMRNNGELVYCYQDGCKKLDVKELLELSDGATMQLVRSVTADGTLLPLSTQIDLTANNHVYLFLRVTSEGNKFKRDYILEVVSASDYQADQKLPPVLFDDGPVIQ